MSFDCFNRNEVRRADGPGVCYAFLKGQCHRHQCKFAHDAGSPSATVINSAICRDYQKGRCSRPYCKFRHDDEGTSTADSSAEIPPMESFSNSTNLASPHSSFMESTTTPIGMGRRQTSNDKRDFFGNFRAQASSSAESA